MRWQLFGFGDNSFGQLGCINECNDDLEMPECKYMCPSTHSESELVLSPSELMSFSPSVAKDDTILVRGARLLAGAFHSMLLTSACSKCVEVALAAKLRCKDLGCRCNLHQQGRGLCVAEEVFCLPIYGPLPILLALPFLARVPVLSLTFALAHPLARAISPAEESNLE